MKKCSICKIEKPIMDYTKNACACRPCTKIQVRGYYLKHREFKLQRLAERHKARRLFAMSLLCKGEVKCQCCGEGAYPFLAFDHIQGTGAKLRKDNPKEHLTVIDQTIKNWACHSPYQVLCHNCNFAKKNTPGLKCPVHMESL